MRIKGDSLVDAGSQIAALLEAVLSGTDTPETIVYSEHALRGACTMANRIGLGVNVEPFGKALKVTMQRH